MRLLSSSTMVRAAAALLTGALTMLSSPSGWALDFKPPPKGTTTTVVVGVGGSEPDLTYLPIWLAKYGGYFDDLKADGITVNVVPFTGGGVDAILALTTGKTQLSYQSFENAVRARAQGRDVTYIFNAIMGPTSYVVIRKDLVDKIKSPADAKGLRWGVTGFGAASHQAALRIVRHYGLDPAQVQFLALGGHDGMAPALRQNRVEILSTSVPLRNELEHEGLTVDLLNLNDRKVVRDIMGHDYIGVGLLSTTSWTEANPYATFRVLQAVQKAVDAIRSTPPAEIAKRLPAQFQGPVTVESIQALVPAYNPDGVTAPDTVKAMIADLTDLKITRPGTNLMDSLDNRFIEEVHKADK